MKTPKAKWHNGCRSNNADALSQTPCCQCGWNDEQTIVHFTAAGCHNWPSTSSKRGEWSTKEKRGSIERWLLQLWDQNYTWKMASSIGNSWVSMEHLTTSSWFCLKISESVIRELHEDMWVITLEKRKPSADLRRDITGLATGQTCGICA